MIADHLKVALLSEDTDNRRCPDQQYASALARPLAEVCGHCADMDDVLACLRAAMVRCAQAARAETAENARKDTNAIAALRAQLAAVRKAVDVADYTWDALPKVY